MQKHKETMLKESDLIAHISNGATRFIPRKGNLKVQREAGRSFSLLLQHWQRLRSKVNPALQLKYTFLKMDSSV